MFGPVYMEVGEPQAPNNCCTYSKVECKVCSLKIYKYMLFNDIRAQICHW